MPIGNRKDTIKLKLLVEVESISKHQPALVWNKMSTSTVPAPTPSAPFATHDWIAMLRTLTQYDVAFYMGYLDHPDVAALATHYWELITEETDVACAYELCALFAHAGHQFNNSNSRTAQVQPRQPTDRPVAIIAENYICMALSKYAPAKRVAVLAMNRTRGLHEKIAGGFKCPGDGCGSTDTISMIRQMNSGDEGARIVLNCNACKRVTVIA